MRKDSFVVFILIVLALLLAVFYVQPLIIEDNDLQGKMEQVELLRLKATDNLEKAKTIKEHYTTMTEREKERLTKQIPETLDQQSIIDNLASIAKDQGVILSSVSFSKLTGKDLPHRVSILANFTSSSTNTPIVSFLRAVERNDRFFSLKSVAVNLAKTRSDYTIAMEAYYKQ